MPEGPEVKNLVNYLNENLEGKQLLKITVNSGPHKKFIEDIEKYLNPVLNKKDKIIKIYNVNCKGKFIYFTLILYEKDSLKKIGLRYIGNQLGLTGDWNLNRSNNNILELDFLNNNKVEKIYFNDTRRFGRLYWLTHEQLQDKLNDMGPDVLDQSFTEKVFDEIFSQKKLQNKMIVQVLNDQKIISGIGNYLRADILYLSKIHPETKVENLTKQRLKILYENIKIVIEYASTHNDTIIYGKTEDKLGNPVKKMTITNRTIWYVPAVQKY